MRCEEKVLAINCYIGERKPLMSEANQKEKYTEYDILNDKVVPSTFNHDKKK